MDRIESLLARIDERTKRIEDELDNFIRKEEFYPIKQLCYGAVAIILIGAMTIVGNFIFKV